MSAFQWMFIAAAAFFVAGLIQWFDSLLTKTLRRNGKISLQSRGARFAAMFAFSVYAIARVIDPGLDNVIHPIAFMASWLVIFGFSLHFVSERFDKDDV